MNIITSFIRTLDYPNVLARSQPVEIIEVALYMDRSEISQILIVGEIEQKKSFQKI